MYAKFSLAIFTILTRQKHVVWRRNMAKNHHGSISSVGWTKMPAMLLLVSTLLCNENSLDDFYYYFFWILIIVIAPLWLVHVFQAPFFNARTKTTIVKTVYKFGRHTNWTKSSFERILHVHDWLSGGCEWAHGVILTWLCVCSSRNWNLLRVCFEIWLRVLLMPFTPLQF